MAEASAPEVEQLGMEERRDLGVANMSGPPAEAETDAAGDIEEAEDATKMEPNDSEAETEILSGSRRQTPRKPAATLNGIDAQDSKPLESPTRPRSVKRGTSSPRPSSPKKRKVEEEGNKSGASAPSASSEEDEEDVVVRRTRVKRQRKAPKKRLESEEDDGSNASPDETDTTASRPDRKSIPTLDLSTSAKDAHNLTDESSSLHSPRLRTRNHRRSLSLHPASGKQPDMSTRYFSKTTSRGSEDPQERATSQPASSQSRMLPGVRLDRHGQTALHKACSSGDAAKTRQLLDQAPDRAVYCNYPDNAKNTALHAAALKGRLEIVKILVEEYDAEISPVNDLNDKPINDADDNGHEHVVEYLLSKGSDLTKPIEKNPERKPRNSDLYIQLNLAGLKDACKRGATSQAQYILSSDIAADTECVVAAVRTHNDVLLNLLMASHAPIGEPDDEGKTPLDHAVECGNDSAVGLLVTNGAGPDPRLNPQFQPSQPPPPSPTTQQQPAPAAAASSAPAPAPAPQPPALDSPPPPPQPPPPAPPAALAYALAHQLSPGPAFSTSAAAYTLDDLAHPLRHFARSTIDLGASDSPKEERWVPSYQVSLILGHSDLSTLKTTLESQYASEEEPATLAIAQDQRIDLIWKGLGLQNKAATTRNWMYLGTGRDKMTPEAVVELAQAEGFGGVYLTGPEGRKSLSVKFRGPWKEEALEKWKDLNDEQLYWVRLEDANRLIKEAIDSQDRRKGMLFNIKAADKVVGQKG